MNQLRSRVSVRGINEVEDVGPGTYLSQSKQSRALRVLGQWFGRETWDEALERHFDLGVKANDCENVSKGFYYSGAK